MSFLHFSLLLSGSILTLIILPHIIQFFIWAAEKGPRTFKKHFTEGDVIPAHFFLPLLVYSLVSLVVASILKDLTGTVSKTTGVGIILLGPAVAGTYYTSHKLIRFLHRKWNTSKLPKAKVHDA